MVRLYCKSTRRNTACGSRGVNHRLNGVLHWGCTTVSLCSRESVVSVIVPACLRQNILWKHAAGIIGMFLIHRSCGLHCFSSVVSIFGETVNGHFAGLLLALFSFQPLFRFLPLGHLCSAVIIVLFAGGTDMLRPVICWIISRIRCLAWSRRM